MVEAVTRRR